MSGIGAAGQANLVNVWETHYKTDLRQVNDLDKEILVQYCEMREEIKDIRRRIGELDKYLEHPPIVSDTVKGTRKDGTYGPIKITGIPDPQYQGREQRENGFGRC